MSVVCDLVLLSWNHLEETQPCLETLFDSTQVPCRLLIVDNGSKPAVRAFLATVKPRGAIRQVELLQNETNEGFPRGMNRGLRASTAPFVCLLNNDLRFTTGWLEELLHVASLDASIGLVNPASSTFGDRPPRGMSLQAYAESRRHFHAQRTEVGMCTGFCMVIPRAVIDRIGVLSDEVDRAFFEDEDYSMRAQQAGYRCVVAAGSYVYHAEHRSVRHLPAGDALFAKNRRWCERKWGRWIRVAWPRFEPIRPGSRELRQWLERLLARARHRSYVHVYCPLPKGATGETLFRSVGLLSHADIHWHDLPVPFASWAAMGAVVSRQKKRFDLIVVPTPAWERILGGLRWFHRAEVVPAGDEARLQEAWERQRNATTARPSHAGITATRNV